ncbi:pyruvate dehydrogenase (acetyl-transferring) E1 component subunit alpha [Altererythrobacter indicus]|uniref:Pyruvate dehydrogenase E1 component subunit alpha n=1 Tax=Altericroceibacterium indicum TaxID=374177 RepID=A0A845A4N4_9SPHN|nr:pyruvate dehydrogenase (acetyl-transferring) E1 component subunit alpha [Altericroceibacterium indicum]MXP25252.1 pyruvate dehydrogenase (acetyl-transferring) E1 component subunit alpha [Altericroceibacterium indicum]
MSVPQLVRREKGIDVLAKPASANSGTGKRAASSGKSTAKTEGAPQDEDFALHSLQEEFEKSKRYKPSEEELLKFYEQMLLIRRFEERAGQLYGLGYIGGFCHLYIGQEAVAVGLQSVLEEGKDSVITGYRDHGHMLAYGIDPKIIMAELTGREAGISHGKGGSMHMFSTEKAFYGGHGIVGAQVPLGAGLALSHQYKGDGGLCVAYFGDGAANQGQVYETFNMASLWNLPIIFVVENNQYAMGTSVKRSSAETHFYRRGTAFRIPGMKVNGMDVLEVHQAAQVAVKHVREGKGPVLMELETYRYRGHSMSDPAKYRTREEVQGVRETSDPIEHAKKDLLEMGYDEEKLKQLDKDIRAKVSEAADFAENSPEPEANELYTDVLVGNY